MLESIFIVVLSLTLIAATLILISAAWWGFSNIFMLPAVLRHLPSGLYRCHYASEKDVMADEMARHAASRVTALSVSLLSSALDRP